MVETEEPPTEPDVRIDGSSTCDRQTGHVIVHVQIANDGDEAVTVIVTEVTYTGESQTVTVPADGTVTVDFDAGPAPLAGGDITVELPDGTVLKTTHSATNACTSTTTTPPTTTTAPPTTTAQPTAPPIVGGTTVHNSRCEGNGQDRPRCEGNVGTRVAPRGLAFTGLDDTVRFAGLALLLFGLGLLLIRVSRQRAPLA